VKLHILDAQTINLGLHSGRLVTNSTKAQPIPRCKTLLKHSLERSETVQHCHILRNAESKYQNIKTDWLHMSTFCRCKAVL